MRPHSETSPRPAPSTPDNEGGSQSGRANLGKRAVTQERRSVMQPSRDAVSQADNLRDCDREPIHIPGRIQSHGVLFALSEPDLEIVQVSANLGELIGVEPNAALGAAILSLVAPAEADRAEHWLRSPKVRESGPCALNFNGRTWHALAHRHDGVLILELENPHETQDPPEYRAVRTAMGRLQRATTLSEFCRVAVDEMRDLTGFDRVTVYRFDDEWNGQVFAEARREDLT
ncbi:MAG TPA: hypothetical protein VGE52_14035, partial [Pirellulales bacterium]